MDQRKAAQVLVEVCHFFSFLFRFLFVCNSNPQKKLKNTYVSKNKNKPDLMRNRTVIKKL